MAPVRTVAALILAASSASAFAPSTPVSKVSRVDTAVASTILDDVKFDDAVKDWEEEYPQFAEWGWGPSVQAEIWNGRHAMFGWVFICATVYAKGHGLIPDPDKALDLKQWGTLATIAEVGKGAGKATITNERAIILIANVHAFMVGVFATIAPLPMFDTLLLDPNHEMYEWQVERNSKLGGVMPDIKQMGINPHAELMNGRLAMMGIIACIGYSFIQGQTMITTVNEWTGGLLAGKPI